MDKSKPPGRPARVTDPSLLGDTVAAPAPETPGPSITGRRLSNPSSPSQAPRRVTDPSLLGDTVAAPGPETPSPNTTGRRLKNPSSPSRAPGRLTDPGLLGDTVAVTARETPGSDPASQAVTAPLHSAPPSSNPGVEPGAILHGGLSSRIGRYVLLRMLGKGGMGVVYAAYDEDLDRRVAVKLLHTARQQDQELRLRIVREAQALARVSSPNVVHVYEVGEIESEMFIAMEFVNGTTLTRWQSAESRSWQETLQMYLGAGQGLLAAHQAGLTHRDFKPDNVLVGSDGTPKVADFGLARLGGDEEGAAAAERDLLDSHNAHNAVTPNLMALTQEGMMVGTPLYMSPEQHLGEPADRRSDQFSFCVALYEALYDERPFAGKTLPSLRHNVVRGRLQPRPTGSRVPEPVHKALLRGLAVLPEKRFPSMQELLTALSFDEARDPAAAPRARRWLSAGLVAFTALSSVATRLILWRGGDPVLSSLGMGVGFFSVFAFLVFFFRRRLLTNAFHRTMVVSGLVFAGQILTLRLAGFVLKLSLAQIFTLDLVTLCSLVSMLSAMALPRLWLWLPVVAAGASAAAFWPRTAGIIAPILTPLIVLAALVLWNRAALTQSSSEQMVRR